MKYSKCHEKRQVLSQRCISVQIKRSRHVECVAKTNKTDELFIAGWKSAQPLLDRGKKEKSSKGAALAMRWFFEGHANLRISRGSLSVITMRGDTGGSSRPESTNLFLGGGGFDLRRGLVLAKIQRSFLLINAQCRGEENGHFCRARAPGWWACGMKFCLNNQTRNRMLHSVL